MQSQACTGSVWLPDLAAMPPGAAAWRRALHVSRPGPLPPRRHSRPLAAPPPRVLEAWRAGTGAGVAAAAAAAEAGGGGGEAGPPPPPLSEEEAKALNRRISGAASAAEVLALVGPRLGALSRINAVTAFHRLAKVRGGGGRRRRRRPGSGCQVTHCGVCM